MLKDSSKTTNVVELSKLSEDEIIKTSHTVTWGPFSAVLVSVLSFASGFLLAGSLIYFAASVFGHSSEQTETWLNSVAGQFIFVLLAEGLIVACLAWFLHFRKTSLRALGYHRRPQINDVGLAIIGFITYFIVLLIATSLAGNLLGIDTSQKQELGFDSVVGLREKIMAFVSLVILPPLVEETLFRGFLFTGLRKKLPFVWTTIFVSLVFATLHLFASSQGLLWIAGIDTLLLSLALCYLREKTGNLWAPIMVHALKNCLAFLFLYVFVLHA
jgi:membrane protease YdiL (CAAX protease family)